MLDLIRSYNPHWAPDFQYDLIERDRYCRKLLDLTERREILVLKGIRRAGKSSLLKLLINDLIRTGVPRKNILFMNLEDYRLGGVKSLDTLDKIYRVYRELPPEEGRRYILLDEIQEIPGFEKWLRAHYEQSDQLKFIITGSSSSLFSRELASLLTGRQVSVEVFPFSFREYLSYHEAGLHGEVAKKSIDALYLAKSMQGIAEHLEKFLDGGGFPEMIKNPGREGNILTLQQYISDIILRDIAQRYNIRKLETLQKLALYLIFNMGNYLNVSRVAQVAGSNRTTVLELIAYLKEVYLIFTSPRYSFVKEDLLSANRPKKVYCVDNGFFAAIKTDSDSAAIKRFRNAVFTQLRFQFGVDVYHWREKVEIDFILPDGFPIGVALNSQDTERCVFSLFYYLSHHNLKNGILIHPQKLQMIEENEQRVLLMPLWLFLAKSWEEIHAYLAESF